MILQARWVVPVAAPPIRDGAVQVSADRIVAVGSAGELLDRAEDVVTDLGDAVLTPGLVNPHTHLELTAYAGQLSPGSLWTWLPGLVALRRQPGQVEREQAGVRTGAWQSLRAGVTCVGDISRRALNGAVLKSIPIRKVCFVELLSLADDPPRNIEELRAAAAAVAEDSLLTVGISPHTPYSVHPTAFGEAVRLAEELGRPWCTHWSETPEERAFLRGDEGPLPAMLVELQAQTGLRSPRMSPGAYLGQWSSGVRPGALAHCNYVEPEEFERLAAAGHVVMYCPRAHRFFGHAAHPYRELMAAGVVVALGTDSAASNDDLSLLKEARFLRRETAAAPAADVLLRMITLNAAQALGLETQVGSIETGKQADLAAFACAAGVDDPVTSLIDQAPPPTGVWVAGQRVI